MSGGVVPVVGCGAWCCGVLGWVSWCGCEQESKEGQTTASSVPKIDAPPNGSSRGWSLEPFFAAGLVSKGLLFASWMIRLERIGRWASSRKSMMILTLTGSALHTRHSSLIHTVEFEEHFSHNYGQNPGYCVATDKICTRKNVGHCLQSPLGGLLPEITVSNRSRLGNRQACFLFIGR